MLCWDIVATVACTDRNASVISCLTGDFVDTSIVFIYINTSVIRHSK